MNTIRGKSEAVLGWQEWFLHGDPVATMTHFTQRCWGNKSDPTEHNWQKHHGACCATRNFRLEGLQLELMAPS